MLRRLMSGAASLTLPAAALLTVPLFTHPATQAGEVEPDEAQVVRFVCQEYSDFAEEYRDYIAIFDQLSVVAREPVWGFETVDGTVLIDPHHKRRTSGEVEFRLRIYRDNLISDEKTAEQIVAGLVAREADKDSAGRVMDYVGLGLRFGPSFDFYSTGPYDFVKGATIFLEDESSVRGIMDTNNGASVFAEDGFYRCLEPILRPASG